MKRLYSAIILSLLAIITFHCQREVSGGPFPGNQNGNNTAPVTATIQGNVMDESDLPAVGVHISVGNKTATTDARGYFRIVNASLDKNASLVSAEKSGYFKTYRTFGATSGVNQVVIKLIKKTMAGTVNAGTGGDITLSNGSKITLPANSVVKAIGGASYSGTVNVYAAYLDPSSSDILNTVPGSFMADDKDNKRVLLTSYGMLAVELESAGGEKLQIASGHTAGLTMPVPSSLQASAPASIKLWYVDDQTGLWKEEGEAVKNGNNYTGEVKHFTYWNCDVPGATINLSATFQTSDGAPLAYGSISIRPVTGYGGAAHGYTDSLGQINGPVPANTNLLLEVLGPCGNAIYSQPVGPYSSAANLGTIIIPTSTTSLISVKGRLLDCSNAPVTNGYAIIYYDYFTRYVRVNASGEFSSAFTTCSSAPLTCEIMGVDEAAQQQGGVVNITVASPLTNAGDIQACGTSSSQYINYTIDGVSQSINNTNTDSLYAFASQQGTTTPFSVTVGGGSAALGNIGFTFTSDGTIGSFPLSALRLDFTQTNLIQTATVTVTHYPAQSGDFFEGNFTAQYTDITSPTPVHSISCSFRVRKV